MSQAGLCFLSNIVCERRKVELGFLLKSSRESDRAQMSSFYTATFHWQLCWLSTVLLVGRREGGRLAHFSVPFHPWVGKSSENKNAFSCNSNQNTLWEGCLLPKNLYLSQEKLETIFGLSAHDRSALLQINRNCLHENPPCCSEQECPPPKFCPWK